MAETTLAASMTPYRTGAVFLRLDAAALERHRVLPAREDTRSVRALADCGPLDSNLTVRIVDPDTRCCLPPDRVGEIWIAGPTVARGYWNKPESTRDTFQALTADTGEGPFLRTGDLGFLRNGHLVITGRCKDLIIVHGLNHYPQDIEATAADQVPDPGMGAAFSLEIRDEERVVLVQELRRRKLSREEGVRLIERLRAALSREHGLQAYAVCLVPPGQIHKTSSGKIQRRACCEAFLAGALRTLADYREPEPGTTGPSSHPEAEPHQSLAAMTQRVAVLIAASLNLPPGDLDHHRAFEAYGLGSTRAVSLSGDLGRDLGVSLPASLLYDYPTLSMLAR